MSARQLINEVLKHISTGVDGQSYDMGRVVGLVSVTGYGLMGFMDLCAAIYQGGARFDFSAFGLGYAALAGGTGALIWAKKDTEPKPKDA